MIIDILGDISLAMSCLNETDYMEISDRINRALGTVDFRIANLESPMLDRKDIAPADKEGPKANLSMQKKTHSIFFENIDINAYTLANNHLGDYGSEGINSTINYLNGLNKKYAGSSMQIEKIYDPIRIEQGGGTVSVFSFCENEFGISNDSIGVAGFNEAIIKEKISVEVKTADLIVVIFHGGIEHYPFPSPKQRSRYRWLIDIGADIVIGMHSHCPVGMEKYKNKFIYYGLGNFLFPRKTPIIYSNWNYGYVVRLGIKNKKKLHIEMLPYRNNFKGTEWELCEYDQFKRYMDIISAAIPNDEKLKYYYNAWVQYNGANLYHILKNAISKDENKYSFDIVKNLFSCEAHNELITAFLNNRYYCPDADFSDGVKEIKKYINVKEAYETAEMVSSKNIALWGITEKTMTELGKYTDLKGANIFIVDQDQLKQGLLVDGVVIISPEEVLTKKIDLFRIGTGEKNYKKICEYLVNNGFDKKAVQLIK